MVNFPPHLLIFLFFSSSLPSISSSPLRTLPNNPNFDPHIALVGDAALVAGSHASFVKLTRPVASSFGLLLNAKPFKLHDSSSFSTQFAFWVSPENGDGLVLSIFAGSFFPDELSRENWIHGIEFVAGNGSDSSGGYVRTERGVLVRTSGGKLTSWVDYDSSSKMVEIRLSKFGDSRPYDPSFAYPIDLASKCEGEEVFVGLSSWSSKSSEWSRVFSWRFGLRNVPKWMHSLPADPRRRSENLQKDHLRPLAIFAGLIFATGCGALMAFVVLFIWAIAANRNAIFAAEPRAAEFQYEKVSVVVVEEGLRDVSSRG